MNIFTRLVCGALLGASALSASAATFVGERSDFRDETIYFAITTRFYDGDHSNNTYSSDGDKKVNDPEWRGDFKGLIAKLDYIKALGFTAVWITPVVENASGLDYHGYHAFNFQKVDPRYESEDCKFQDLIDAAHARGMKIILDIVLQHTGNFGEEHLCPMFVKDYTKNLSNINTSMLLHPETQLPSNYYNLPAGQQYSARLSLMKNVDGVNHDVHNYWHHYAHFNWDDPSRWWGQIAGDCVDLNTENPAVYNYIIECYGKFIEMGVDGFRIDTGGHIARLTFNKAFVPGLLAIAEKHKDKRGGAPFFMYTEVCARSQEVIYRGQNYNCSPCFYTWKEEKDYAWSDDPAEWENEVVMEGEYGNATNAKSVLQQAEDYLGHDFTLARSNNAWLDGNNYRTEDYSQYSGLSVIDFPMHWRFRSASNAFTVRSQDDLYNDARYNVVYVDSHDYGPDGADGFRYSWGMDNYAENMSLMFTFRGIPCLYYGSEIEFRAGCIIDKGPIEALKDTGRAYFGGYIEGSVNVSDFAQYSGATGNMAATLANPLSLHIQRLNQIRAAIPALRKGQYSCDGCSGSMSFKRRYVDATTDSYVLVTISGSSTFTNILNGTYTDAITGDVKVVTNNTLTAECSGQGNMRIYVLTTDKTPAPGKIGTDGKYLYATAPVIADQPGYDGNEEPEDTETVRDTTPGTPGTGGGSVEEPETPIEPSMSEGEQAVFFESTQGWTAVNAWIWTSGTNYTGGSWPGQALAYLGNNVWKWSYNGEGKIANALVIFNNGSTQTSKDGWEYVNGGYYNDNGYVKTIEGAGVIPDEPTTPTDPSTYTAFFNNTVGWSVPYVYAWNKATGKTYSGSWPGSAMVLDSESGYYKFTCTVTENNPDMMIIFNNNGSPQTADLTFYNNGVYTFESGFTGEYFSSVSDLQALNLKVYVANGQLVVISPEAASVNLVRVDGSVERLQLHIGINTFDLPRGFYIINNTKVVL